MRSAGRNRACLTLFVLTLVVPVLGCEKSSEGTKPKVYNYTKIASFNGDSKALIYNLIGRWFPKTEIERLDDDSMTPAAWCGRDPSMIRIMLDEVEVQCDSDEPYQAAIARVSRHKNGGIQIILRAAENAPLRTLLFEDVIGKDAKITGSPCSKGALTEHARFPKIEILRRQILGGQRCAQIRERQSLSNEF